MGLLFLTQPSSFVFYDELLLLSEPQVSSLRKRRQCCYVLGVTGRKIPRDNGWESLWNAVVSSRIFTPSSMAEKRPHSLKGLCVRHCDDALPPQGFTEKYFSGGKKWSGDISECLSLWQWQQCSSSLLLYCTEMSLFSAYKFWWNRCQCFRLLNQRVLKTFWFH